MSDALRLMDGLNVYCLSYKFEKIKTETSSKQQIHLPLRRPPTIPLRSPGKPNTTMSDVLRLTDGLNVFVSADMHTLGCKLQKIKIQPVTKWKTRLPLRRPTPNRLPDKPANATTATTDILRLMDGLKVAVPIDVYISLIRECTAARDPVGAGELCCRIIRSGVHLGLPFVNRVLLMLVSCGLVDDARQVFDRMKSRDSNSWATMIGGYMESANYEEAVNLFAQMNYRERLENDDALKIPFSWIIVCVLKGCVETKNIELGKQVHALIMKFGYDEDLYLSSSLMNFYGNFGHLEGLDCVFNHLENRNITIWTNKLVNNCRKKRFKEAIDVFREISREGLKKNEFTFSSVLRACGRVEDDGWCGRQVHANLIKLGFESNDFVQCGLVDMYAKDGMLENAKMVFQAIGGERSMACWNAMLTGYIQHGYCVDAIKVLYAMKSAGLHPQASLINDVRFTCGCSVLEGEMV